MQNLENGKQLIKLDSGFQKISSWKTVGLLRKETQICWDQFPAVVWYSWFWEKPFPLSAPNFYSSSSGVVFIYY